MVTEASRNLNQRPGMSTRASARMTAGRYNKDEFGELSREVWERAYREVGVGRGIELGEISNIRILQALAEVLEGMLMNIKAADDGS